MTWRPGPFEGMIVGSAGRVRRASGLSVNADPAT